MSDVVIANTTSALSGKSVLAADVDATVTGLHSFNRGSGSAPFAVGAGSTVVANLDADKLDGVEGSSFATKTGTETLTNKTLTAPVINFPATQVASSDANSLDDYEEGTWTPVLGGSGGTAGQTYTVQFGNYVKVGKQVTCFFDFTLSAKGTITTLLQIQGLPFTIENTTSYAPSAALAFWSATANSFVHMGVLGVLNTTTANVVGATAAVTTVSTLTTADVGNTTRLSGTFTYRASA